MQCTMGVLCKAKNNRKRIPRIKSTTYEMEIESTKVEMFREEKNTVFCAFTANICPVKKKNSLQLKNSRERRTETA